MTQERPRRLHAQMVDMLGAKIMDGTLQPGTIIDLPALEQEAGISRTVLRESLKVLTEKGLIGARPKKGTYVMEPAAWNMLDNDVLRWRAATSDRRQLFAELAEVRQIIEPAAAALASERATEADIATLRDLLDQMDSAAATAEGRTAAEVDVAFHVALLHATHNDLLISLRGVIEHGLRERDLVVHSHQETATRTPAPSHRQVVDAIATGNAALAADAMRALLASATDDVERLASTI